jgi:hypothetical protein
MMWRVETYSDVTRKWHRLVEDRRSYCEGVYDALTDYTRVSTPIRLMNGSGDVVREAGGGGIQIGMESVPHPPAAWEGFAVELVASLSRAFIRQWLRGRLPRRAR